MFLRLLGVNGPYPASNGATSGYLLEANGLHLQLDFGSGVLSRLTGFFPPEDLDAIFLSHWHFDHTCDLLPLIYRLEALGKTISIYAPEDESSAIRRIVAGVKCFDLRTIAPGSECMLGKAENVRLLVGPARHPVPGVSFRVEAEGKVFGYTGDTNTLPELKNFFHGCDLLLADGLFPVTNWAEGKPHLSAALAAELARDADAAQLVLTHFNPVYSPSILLREARENFHDVSLAQAGALLSL